MLYLGTKDSYGTEHLQILPGPDWEGLTITATFVTPAGSTQVLVPGDGLLTVPPEATAQALSHTSAGKIVFTGVTDGVQRITTDLAYAVFDHADNQGADSQPTPSVWEQFVGQVQQDAKDAAASRQAAETAAQQADATLQQVRQSQTDALEQLSQAEAAATQVIQQAETDSLDALRQAGAEADDALEAAGERQTQALQEAGAAQKADLEAAGQAQLDEIQAANARLPNPTEADAGKTLAITEDGSGYTLQPPAYTQEASDARYAPLDSALRVTGKGTGLASLSPTVSWKLQGLRLHGRSWQDGTPSVENPVPIQSVGRNGTVDVTVCGSNILNYSDLLTGMYDSKGNFSNNSNRLATRKINTFGKNLYLYFPNKTPSGKEIWATVLTYKRGVMLSRKGNNTSPYLIVAGDYDQIAVFFYSALNGTDFDIEALEKSMFANGLMLSYTVGSFEPYQSQQLPIPTPDGLPGIPVDSQGNLTDENGQQWVSDIVDLSKKAKIQNVFQEELELSYSTTYSRYEGTVSRAIKAGSLICLCDVGVYKSTPINNGECRVVPNNQQFILKSDVKVNRCTVLYVLATPIVTPLTDEELAAYRALTTYPGTTNILAPDCGIEATAVGDATQALAQLNDKIAALESAATGI